MKKAVILLMNFVIIFFNNDVSAQSNIKIGDQAPEIFISEWIANTPSKKSLNNKFIVLDFWATWCKPCLDNVPHMNALQNTFSDENITFILMTNEERKVAETAFKKVNFQTPVATDVTSQTHINFGDGRKGLVYYPMSVLIDDQNIIRWYGASDKLTEDMINDFLNRTDIEVDQLSTEGPLYKRQDAETYLNGKFSVQLWSDMFMDPNINQFTYIEEVINETEKKKPEIIMGNGAFFEETTLKKLFRNLFPEKSFILPEELSEKKYNFFFVDKNLDSESENKLIQDILNQLNFKMEKTKKEGVSFQIRIEDKALLMKSNKDKLESIKKVDEGLLNFKTNTLSEVATSLSAHTDYYWTFKGKNKKRYHFEVEIKSIGAIKSSLACYGLEVTEQPVNIETIHVLKGDE